MKRQHPRKRTDPRRKHKIEKRLAKARRSCVRSAQKMEPILARKKEEIDARALAAQRFKEAMRALKASPFYSTPAPVNNSPTLRGPACIYVTYAPRWGPSEGEPTASANTC